MRLKDVICAGDNFKNKKNNLGYANKTRTKQLMPITVANKHKLQEIPKSCKTLLITVDRSTALGNPFTHMQYIPTKAQYICTDREQSINKYREWLLEKIKQKDKAVTGCLNVIYTMVKHGFDVYLLCSCKPKSCYADIIKEIIDQKLSQMPKLIEYVQRKSLKIKDSGRSSDFITPSFGHGCLYKCAYCTMRRNKPNGVTIATNTDDILRAVAKHLNTLPTKEQYLQLETDQLKRKSALQTHPTLWTYDISCNEDMALHAKYHKLDKIFQFFIDSPKAMATMATKKVNRELLSFNPNKKIRIRFSLMPQLLSDIQEPNTSKIIDRIKAINEFHAAGYDVHINYSPVIITKTTTKLYTELFQLVDSIVDDSIKPSVKCEVIFLTHNDNMHKLNISENPKAEQFLWRPHIQEPKTSQHGGKNIRYKHELKTQFVNQFKELHQSILDWQEIRYIF